MRAAPRGDHCCLTARRCPALLLRDSLSRQAVIVPSLSSRKRSIFAPCVLAASARPGLRCSPSTLHGAWRGISVLFVPATVRPLLLSFLFAWRHQASITRKTTSHKNQPLTQKSS